MLEALNKAIQKKFSKTDDNIIYDRNRKVEAVTSGSLIVDQVSGVGGLLVKGHITEISGLESSGKTTLCLQSAAFAQSQGQVGIFLDIEQTFDAFYAEALGLEQDGKTFEVYQPGNAEQLEMIVDMACKELGDDLDYIIWDSLAAAKPKAMLEARQKEDESSRKGQQAAFMSEFFPKLSTLARKYQIAILVTNQLRQKIEFSNMYQAKAVRSGGLGAGYSNDTSWYTMGGNAPKYHYSMRFLLEQMRRQKETDDDGDVEEVGNWIRISNIKNKLSIPFRKAEFVIIFGDGTNDDLAILATLENYGVLYAEGRTWKYEGLTSKTTISKGNVAKDNFIKLLVNNKDIMKDAKQQYSDLLIKNNRVDTGKHDDDEIELDEDEEGDTVEDDFETEGDED